MLYPNPKKILFALLLTSLANTSWAKKYELPKITVSEAIHVAEKYVAENKTDSSTLFIYEVVYMNMYDEYKPAYWRVTWQFVPRDKGAWFEIRIYNDGKIEQYSGE